MHLPKARWGRTSERGQSLAEFALLAPLLLTLVFGVVDFGRGMSANVTVANAAKEGARYLATTAAQIAPDPGTQSNGLRVFKYLDCPNTTISPPTAPDPNSAQYRAWQQLVDANLSVSSVTALTVRFYAPGNNPASGGSPDDTFTCTSSNGRLNGASTETQPTYQPQTGGWVQFQVTYTFAPSTPFISAIVNSITLNQMATMVLE